MFLKTLTLLALLLALSQAEVVVLDDSNYTSFVQQHPYVFVKFYAPWCGHCQAMAQDYIKLSEAAAGKQYIIAEVDATVAVNVSSQLGIQGYPTLKFIVSGNVLDYEGDRASASIQSWVQSLIKAEIKELTEVELNSLIGTENFIVVQGASNEQLKSLALSQHISKVPFHAFAGSEFKLTAYLKDSKTVEYTGEVKIKQVANWATQQTLGHLVPLSGQNIIKQIFENEARLPAFLLLKNPDFTNEAFQILTAFCASQQQQLKCGYADQTHEIFKGIARFLKAESSNQSFLAFFDFGIKNGYKFSNLSEISEQSLSQFLLDINQGKIEKFHDEQKLKKQKQIKYNHVVKLTNQTYNQTLQDNKYVFIEYYSATCGHCVKFAPQYEQLAEKLKSENSPFLIAAVDLSVETELKEQLDVSSFPTFRFYANGEQLDYNGGRDGDSITNFLNQVTKSKLKTVSSIEELEKPAVAVYGIDENSAFNFLPFVFKRFPVYQVLGESSFKVEIHEKKFASYSGEPNLKAVANWLDELTEPSIIKIAEAEAPKKLNKAFADATPLLVIINRDNSEAFNTAFTFLQTFCEEQNEYICGVASKGDSDFQNFNDWVGDPYSEVSEIIYINTQSFEKYLYVGELAALNADSVNQFVSDIKAGKIPLYKGKVDIEIDATQAGKAAANATASNETATETEGQTAQTEGSVEAEEQAGQNQESLIVEVKGQAAEVTPETTQQAVQGQEL